MKSFCFFKNVVKRNSKEKLYNVPRNFNMTITAFKKNCRSDDQFKKCPYSSHCIRKDFFCDNRVNCISSNRDMAGYDESGVHSCDKRGKNIFLIFLAVSNLL